MSLQFVAGSPGSGKSTQVYRRIIEASMGAPEEHFLVIVPEQATLQTQRSLIAMHPRRGIMNIDVLSFARLGYRVFDETGAVLAPALDDLGKVLVLRRILTTQKENLTVLARGAGKIGFAEEVKSLISEFSQYNVSTELLEGLLDQLSGKPLLLGKLRDVLLIYREYQKYLSGRFTTTEWMMQELAKRIPASELLAGATVVLDGFTGFTPQQLTLIREMLGVCRRVIVTVTIDARIPLGEDAPEYELFHMSQTMVRSLRDLARKAGTPEEDPVILSGEPVRYAMSPDLAMLEHNLYRYPWESREEKPEDIRIVSCSNPEEEAAAATEAILALVREQGLRFDEIGVISGDPTGYARRLEKAFGRAGVPCFIDQREPIAGSALPEFLLGALECIRSDFTARGVFRMLRSGLFGMSPEQTDLLDNYVRAHGIRGLGSWSRTWEYGPDAAECEPLRAEFFGKVETFAGAMGAAETAGAMTRALYDFLGDLQVYERIMETGERFAGDPAAPICARMGDQIYGAVLKIFDQITELMGEEELSCEEYGRILEEGLNGLKVGQIPGSNNRVLVGDMKRTRLDEIRALFVLGTNDGVTPPVSSPGGILTDREKEVLAARGVELSPTVQEETCQDIFYLYLNLTKPGKYLWLSYAQSDSEGKALNPSGVLAKIRQIFPALTVEEDGAREKELSFRLRGDDGLGFLAGELRKPEEERDPLTEELLRYYRQNGREEELRRLLEGVFFTGDARELTPEEAELLYGTHLHGSVTGLSRYADCPFAYFAGNGLRLQERKEFVVQPFDLGNLLHDAAERFGRRCQREGLSWGALTDPVRDAMANEALQEAVDAYGDGLFRKDSRSEHLAERLKKPFLRTMKVLCHQASKGEFEPVEFEAAFDRIPELTYDLGRGRKLTLRGKIDRIDTARVGEDSYVKVIDYKTGGEKYDWSRMYAGLQMQLPVYLKGALSLTGRLSGQETHPAGFFYYRMHDPFLKDVKEEDAEQKYVMELRPDGLANESPRVLAALDRDLGDGEKLAKGAKSDAVRVRTTAGGEFYKEAEVVSEIGLQQIIRQTDRNLVRFGQEILSGRDAAEPYRYSARTDDNACMHCAFRAVCGFDRRMGDFHYRPLMSCNKEQILRWIAEEEPEDE